MQTPANNYAPVNSEPHAAEEALLKSEERWRRVFENSAIGVALTTTQGRFIAANTAYQRLVGYTEEELHGCSFLDLTHEEDRVANAALIAELLDEKRQQFLIEKRYRRKDGQFIWVRNNVSLVPGTESEPRFLMAIVEDISERKRLQSELETERDRLRLLLDLTNNVLAHLELHRLCRAIATSIRRVMHCDFAGLALPLQARRETSLGYRPACSSLSRQTTLLLWSLRWRSRRRAMASSRSPDQNERRSTKSLPAI